MRRVVLIALAAVLLGWSPTVWAKCLDGQVLKKIGNVQTASAVLSTQGHDVHAISVDCSGTACNIGLFNADQLDGLTADVVIEVGGAASASLFLDLTDSPLYFSEGVTLVDDSGNIDAAAAYSCQPR